MIDKMIARKPELRYQNCTELIKDLEGLGLTNPVLSFLSAEDQAGARRSGSHAVLPQPGPATVARPAAPTSPGSLSAAASSSPASLYESEPTDTEVRWYLSMKDHTGRSMTRKLTTAGVIAMIKRGELHPETPASNELNSGYRPLGGYTQFHTLLHPKSEKDKADRKVAQFQQVYAQFDKEDKTRRRWRWIHNLFLSVGGFVKFVVWLAILAGICVAFYFGISWGLKQFHVFEVTSEQPGADTTPAKSEPPKVILPPPR